MRSATRRELALILLVGLVALGSCQRQQSIGQQPAAPAAGQIANTVVPAASTVEGWRTDVAAYALMGATAPAFEASLADGKGVSQAALRGRWTILAFWDLSSDASKTEANYIYALNSAADQDPDLDVLSVNVPAAGGAPINPKTVQAWFAAKGASPWPTVIDHDGKIAGAFGLEEAPFYLLIGPDLRIEAYRGALSQTPEDGVKSVIRGVAQIKKQIANPT